MSKNPQSVVLSFVIAPFTATSTFEGAQDPVRPYKALDKFAYTRADAERMYGESAYDAMREEFPHPEIAIQLAQDTLAQIRDMEDGEIRVAHTALDGMVCQVIIPAEWLTGAQMNVPNPFTSPPIDVVEALMAKLGGKAA